MKKKLFVFSILSVLTLGLAACSTTAGPKGDKGDPGEPGQPGQPGPKGDKGDPGQDAKSIEEKTVDNLNSKLAVVDLNNNRTPHERFGVAQISDLNLAALSRFDTRYLYSFRNNKFIVIDDAGYVSYPNTSDYPIGSTLDPEVDNTDLWTLVTNDTDLNEYFSNYLVADFFDTDSDGFEVSTGVDVGSNGAFAITYENLGTVAHNDVILRTNGGTLTINGPLDTVRHFGEGNVLTISAVASSSYHEFGYFPKASIEQGRIVVEDLGLIQVLDASGATEDVKVENQGSGEISNIVVGGNTHVVVDPSVEENVATLAVVTTWAALKEEVEDASGADVVRFEPTAEEANVATISVNRSVSILGNGVRVTGRPGRTPNAIGGIKPRYNGLFNVVGEGIDFSIDNMFLEDAETVSSNKATALNINNTANNSKISISSSTLLGRQYTICTDMLGNNQTLNLFSVNFDSRAYNALYWRSNNGHVYASLCDFRGTNTSGGATNSFTTIAVCEPQTTDTGYPYNNKVENNEFVLSECEVLSSALGTAKQSCVAIYSPFNNNVYFNGCNMDGGFPEIEISKMLVTGADYNSTEYTSEGTILSSASDASHIYIDGRLADNDLDVFIVASNCELNSLCVPTIGGTYSEESALDMDYGDYAPFYGYEKVENPDGTWSVVKSN